jgi:hypothetical protein
VTVDLNEKIQYVCLAVVGVAISMTSVEIFVMALPGSRGIVAREHHTFRSALRGAGTRMYLKERK